MTTGAGGLPQAWADMTPEERDRRVAQFEGDCPKLPSGVLLYSRLAIAAAETGFWIVARKTNEHAHSFIGKPGYVPKGVSCKAKTAKDDCQALVDGTPRWIRSGGLVASPRLLPSAFAPGSLQGVLHVWHDFERRHLVPNDPEEYRLDTRPGSRHYGCLLKGTSWIHSDLDLFDVIKPASALSTAPNNERIRSEQLQGQTNLYTEYARIAGNKINLLMGAPVVQHGAQAQFGDFDSEALDVFAPDGRMFELRNRMFARGWYLLRWPGRAPVAALGRGDRLFEGARPYGT